MASTKRPILTIAIPTYNRANLLNLSLLRIIDAVKGYEDDVEIVVSDNCSTDDTANVVKNAQRVFPIRYFKNAENIGFNYNYIKLIDNYALGEYCWVIGDDDCLYSNAIKEIFAVLKSNENLSCIYAKFDFKKEEEVLQEGFSKVAPNVTVPGKRCAFEELISKVGAPGNLMLTFISSMIFKTDLMKSIDKSFIAKESWETFYNLFPHSYFYSLIMKDKMAYVFDYPIVTAIVHNKSWDSKAGLLYLKFLPEVHQNYLDQGFEKSVLRPQEKLIIRAGIPYLALGMFSSWSLIAIKLKFLRRYLLDNVFYSSIWFVLKSKVRSMIRQ